MRRLTKPSRLAEKIGAALRTHPIRYAYVYGSLARGDPLHRESDVDVAIYPHPKLSTSRVDDLQLDLMDVVARALDLPLERVDVKLLNRMPLPLAFRVYAEGLPVAVLDRDLHTREFLRVTARYHDEEPLYARERTAYFAKLLPR